MIGYGHHVFIAGLPQGSNTPKYQQGRPNVSQNVYPVEVNRVIQLFIRLDPFESGLVLVLTQK